MTKGLLTKVVALGAIVAVGVGGYFYLKSPDVKVENITEVSFNGKVIDNSLELVTASQEYINSEKERLQLVFDSATAKIEAIQSNSNLTAQERKAEIAKVLIITKYDAARVLNDAVVSISQTVLTDDKSMVELKEQLNGVINEGFIKINYSNEAK